MSMKLEFLATVMALSLAFSGCMAPSHKADVASGGNLTVGTVQKEIKKGMSGAEVTTALGSPNIVTTDAQMRETWVYDKISTEVTESKSAAGIPLLIFGTSGSKSKSQKTLTVVIKFDEKSKVREFAYHTSRF
jgi:outer membrane protein assembly factor BamE (lipoprotein component of BamABCDE complex)